MEMERRDSDTRRLQHVAAARSVDALLAAMVLASRSPAGRRRLLGVPAISYRGVQPSLGTDPERVVTHSHVGQQVVTVDGDEGTVIDITSDFWGALVAIDIGGAVIELPEEQVEVAW